VRTWDFRAENPKICSWKEQEGDINALKVDTRHNLLSASSDGTLAAYEVRKRKLRMRSEMMHSELVSLCVTDKYVYAGGRDGYLEVFVHGDYGNILERIETGFEMGVDDVVELRKGLLLTCSGVSDKLKLINVMPTKKLGTAGTHGNDDGIDQLMVTPDGSTLISMSTFANSLKFWPLAAILEKIPVLRVVDIKKRKPVVKEGFFDDIMSKKKKRRAEDSDEDNNVLVNGIMIRCDFCSTERREQYKCPRCNANYCSLRCYRCEKHSNCSESFYKECVKEQLEGRHFEGGSEKQKQDTFEERMKKYLNGEIEDLPGASASGATGEGEPLDSDDEEAEGNCSFPSKENQYLQKVVEETIDDYVLDEDEIDRKLLGLGIGGEVEQLLGVLSEEERATFAQLAEQIHIDTTGLHPHFYLYIRSFLVVSVITKWLTILYCAALTEMLRSAIARVLARRLATRAEIVDESAQKQVCSTISSEVADPANRLFAVVYVNGRQFKVSQNDLIALRGSLPLAAGERIKLEKVLMVGSSNFSVFGRPLLNSVTVEATVVEKTTTYPELRYDRNNHRHIKAIHWLSEEMTVLRINEISAKDLMKEPSS
ncbi:ribosomal protein L21, partial [Oesophagostomum dentatum]